MGTYNVQIEVTGMTCQHCVNTITTALKQLSDIDPTTVIVDLDKNQASFQWTGANKDDIKSVVTEIIQDLGYEPGDIRIDSTGGPSSSKRYRGQLSISGMTCSHCTNTIHKALCSLPFVDKTSVEVSLDTESVTIIFNGPDLSVITKDKLKETIEDLGYDVTNVSLHEDEERASSHGISIESSTDYKIASFVLAGMTCQHCVKIVSDTLKALPGVVPDSVFVSLEKRQGRFLFEGDVINKETIKEIIEDLGYDVEGTPRIIMDTNDTHSILSKSFPNLNHLEINMGTTKVDDKEKRKVVMRVLGMTCHSCVASVTDAIKTTIPNVLPNSVHVNLETEMAMFICTNPQIDVIREAIEDRGFEIENVQFIHNLNPTAVVVGRRISEHEELLVQLRTTRQQSIVSLGAISIDSSLAVSAPHKVKLQINGMTCSSCVRTVERGLSNLPGVDPLSVQVNLLTHSGSFNMKGDKLDEKTIIKAVKSMGYTASNVVFIVESAQAKEHAVGTNFKANMIITGMFCGNCTEKVHGALSKLHGIDRKSIEISLESGRTSFEFTGEYITRQRIHQAILQLGFVAESIKIAKLANQSTASDTASISSQNDKNTATTHLVITGMTCSSCVANIERTMMKQDGVISCQVNLLARSCVIKHNPNIVGSRSLAQMIEQIGYKAELSQDNQGNDLSEQRASMREVMDKEIAELRSRFYWSLLFAIPVVLISMIFMMALPASNPVHRAFMKEITHGLTIGDLILFLLATPVQFWLGLPFYTKAYKSLVYSRTANMETLVAMGTTVAYVASVAAVIAAMARPDVNTMSMNYFETSVLLITFIHFGKWLEALAKGKTAETITKLMDLQPETATLVEISKNPRTSLDTAATITGSSASKKDEVINEENTFVEREIESKDIQVGDVLKVNAGGRIPCDGKIWKGNSTTDESMITGESVPVNKKEGDSVITATINLSSPIYIRAIRVGADTTLSRIIQLVNDAQASPKAPIEQLADNISSVFVPVVIVLAIITFIVWEVASFKNLYPEDWLPMGENKTIFSLMLAVSVLVIACPCGLGLASPTAVMVGTGVAARYGVLVKGGGYALEMANRITTVAFDKTGTLTLGKPVVTNSWIDLPTAHDDADYSLQKIAVWKILGRVGSASNHPLSKSIEKKARFIISTLMQNPKATDVDLIQDNLEAEDFVPESTNDFFEGVTITNAQEVAGRGLLATLTLSQAISEKLSGKLHNVRAVNVFLGNQEWMNENYARYQNKRQAKECSELLGNWQDQGQSIVLVSASPVGGNESVENVGTHSDGCKNACACAVCHCSSTSVCCTASQTMMIAQLAIADIPRPEATQLITELRKRKIEVWMITGDNARTGQVIGEKLGIPKDFVLAGVKPEQKSDKIRNLQRRGIRGHSVHGFWRKHDGQPETAVVAMVGDGINDSPALAQADVGISVGSATDIAIEAASIVLIRNNLMDLLTMYDVSKTVVHRIRLNFLWAFLYNAVAIPIAAGILYPACGQGLPPYVAGLAMVASSVSVVCSSLLLRLYKAPKIVEESHQLRI